MKLLHGLLWASVGAMLCLTFAWPFARSSDPADPAFKLAAIAVFALFLVSLAVIIVEKACRAPRT